MSEAIRVVVLFVRGVMEQKSMSYEQKSMLIGATIENKFNFSDKMEFMGHFGDVCLIRYATEDDPAYCVTFTENKIEGIKIQTVDPKHYNILRHIVAKKNFVHKSQFIKAVMNDKVVGNEIIPSYFKTNLYFISNNTGIVQYLYVINDNIIIENYYMVHHTLIQHNMFDKVLDDMIREKYTITKDTRVFGSYETHYLYEQETLFPAFLITDGVGKKITIHEGYIPYMVKLFKYIPDIPLIFDIVIYINHHTDVFFSQPVDNIKDITCINSFIVVNYKDNTADVFNTLNHTFRLIDNKLKDEKNNEVAQKFSIEEIAKKVELSKKNDICYTKIAVDEFSEFPSSAELVAQAQEKVKEHILQNVKIRKSTTLSIDQHFNNPTIKSYIARLCAERQYNFTDIDNTITITFL